MFFSCKKNRVNAGSKVEIYLLEIFELFSDRCEVNPVGAALRSSPLVMNSGYPGGGQALNAYMKRNDPRLIAALSAQRKLR